MRRQRGNSSLIAFPFASLRPHPTAKTRTRLTTLHSAAVYGQCAFRVTCPDRSAGRKHDCDDFPHRHHTRPATCSVRPPPHPTLQHALPRQRSAVHNNAAPKVDGIAMRLGTRCRACHHKVCHPLAQPSGRRSSPACIQGTAAPRRVKCHPGRNLPTPALEMRGRRGAAGAKTQWHGGQAWSTPGRPPPPPLEGGR